MNIFGYMIFGSFEGVDESRGEESEKREKERETGTETDTEPHRTTLHHISYNTLTSFSFHFRLCS